MALRGVAFRGKALLLFVAEALDPNAEGRSVIDVPGVYCAMSSLVN